MVGLSTAYFLQERGIHVTVVDRIGVGAGSSWGNAGWIAPALTLPLPEPAVLGYGLSAMLRPSSPLYIPFSLNPRLIRFLLGFARACLPGTWRSSLAVYAEVSRIAMAAFDELTDGGVAEPTHLAEPFLAGFSSAKEREGLVQEFRLSESGGVGPDYDLVTGDEMRAIEPTLGAGVTAGVRLHGQHFINPPKFVDALAEAVRSRGGSIVTGFSVTAVHDLGSSGVEVVPASGDPLRADAVVLASGSLAGHPGPALRSAPAGAGRPRLQLHVVPEVMPTRPIYFPAAAGGVHSAGRPVPGQRHDGVPRPPRRRWTRVASAPSWRRPARCSPASTGRTARRSGSGRAPAHRTVFR